MRKGETHMVVNCENMERQKQKKKKKTELLMAKYQFTFKSFTNLLVNLTMESPSGTPVLILGASFLVYRARY